MMKIKKAVIPVAGLGTRLLPATKAIPKELLPIVDRPAIQYVVEEIVQSGIEQVIFVNARGKEAIEDYFDTHIEIETILKERQKLDLLEDIHTLSRLAKIATVRQKAPLGLGHAILCAKNLVGNEPFAVLLADDVIDASVPCIKQLLQVYEKEECSVIALMRVEKSQAHLYGMADATSRKNQPRTYSIKNLLEKPSIKPPPSDLAIAGRYVLTPEIFTVLEKTATGTGGELQLTDGLVNLLHKQKIVGYRYEGRRFDAGDKFGFLEANIYYALKRPELREKLVKLIRELEL